MDERWAPVLLFGPVVIVVIAYLFAWRSKSTKLRKSGSKVLAAIVGFIGLFASWWALGMTMAVWSEDGSKWTFWGVLLRLLLEMVILFFPACLWYLCIGYGTTAEKQQRPPHSTGAGSDQEQRL